MVPHRVLVVGCGSVGTRHAANLVKIGAKVEVVSQKDNLPYITWKSLDIAISKGKFDAAVICSPTYLHLEQLESLFEERIPTLIEKPLASSSTGIDRWRNETDGDYRVGYLMRYHPVIEKVSDYLVRCGEIHHASFRFGQYLPLWRPGGDYRDHYSAYSSKGGGILLDSSHEIDLMFYLLGEPVTVVGTAGKLSKLEITSEDFCSVLFELTGGMSVELQLNYIQRNPERRISIDGAEGGIYANLLTGEVCFTGDSGQVSEKIVFDRNDMFKREIYDFLFSRNRCILPKINEGCIILDWIDNIKESNSLGLR